ncbi:MAG TPA: endonuclease/exonuclease/phosphatase family protein [Tepidisphaeraceae bacterium]|nr:endonuclease/exonuclease/phosphatase family protein [Tepidisphaeraceae bacterium]
MVNILLWNVSKNDVRASIAQLSKSLAVDIFIFIEPPPASDGIDLEAALNVGVTQKYHHVPAVGCTHIHVSSRLPVGQIAASVAARRFAVYRLTRPKQPGVLIAAAHLLAKWPPPNSPENQRSFAHDFSEFIRRAERKHKHTRTIVAGDLNMNPSDSGMVSADGLHAVPSRAAAGLPTRNVNGTHKGPLFFNPSFSLWGDMAARPPGTTYLKVNIADCIFWSVFDQVLYRKDAAAFVDDGSLRIIDSDGFASLRLNTGVPNQAISGHLPVFFTLKV